MAKQLTTFVMYTSINSFIPGSQACQNWRLYVMDDILITDNFTTFPMVIIGLLFIDVIQN